MLMHERKLSQCHNTHLHIQCVIIFHVVVHIVSTRSVEEKVVICLFIRKVEVLI